MGRNNVSSFSYKEDKEAIVNELDIIAAREGKRKSEIIVSLIEEYVKAHSAGNDSFKLDNWSEDPEFKAVPTYYVNLKYGFHIFKIVIQMNAIIF